MKILKHNKITGPSGVGEADLYLEVTDGGATQLRLVCNSCESEKVLDLGTPEEDSKAIVGWLSEHAH